MGFITLWGDRRDLNPRVPEPQPGALTNFATIAMCLSILQHKNLFVNSYLEYLKLWYSIKEMEVIMKIAFVTDSSAGITLEDEKKMGIYVLRMPLTINEETHLEASTITREALIEAMIDGKVVHTSQPNIQDSLDRFEELLKDYDHIVYLPISKFLSGTYDTANMLAQELDGRLTVVDTNFVSWPLRQMTQDAKALGDLGYKPEEIKEILETQSYMYATLIPQDIQYLKRGGRIKPTAAAVANLLKIMPVLEVTEGEIDLYEKVRTHRKALMKAFERILEFQPFDDYHWAVLDGGSDPGLVESFTRELEDKTGCPVHQGHIYPIVLGHTGPGTIAFSAVKKIKELV